MIPGSASKSAELIGSAPPAAVPFARREAAIRDHGGHRAIDSRPAAGPGLAEIRAGEHFYLRWPAVRSCASLEDTLFGLAEPVHVLSDGAVRLETTYLSRVENAGWLDEYELRLAETVLAWLEKFPLATLGLPLLAAGLGKRSAWTVIANRLAQRRDLAVRLTIELRFQSESPDVSKIANFAAHCRDIGCRIAMSGFGDGDLAIAHIIAARPANVRIAPSFVARAGLSDDARDLLAHLVATIDGLTDRPAAIVDGVEDRRAAEIAHECGAHWMAGRYCGFALRGFAPVQALKGRMRFV